MEENKFLEDAIRKLIPKNLKNKLLTLGAVSLTLGFFCLGYSMYRNDQYETRQRINNEYRSIMWKERQRIREAYDLYWQGVLKVGPQASQSLEEEAEKHLVGGKWWHRGDTSGLWHKKFCLGQEITNNPGYNEINKPTHGK